MSGCNGVRRLFVGHLSSQTTLRDLEDTFGKYGRVCHVNLKSNGYAFVDFSNYQDADNAIKHLNGAELNNRRMVVEFATPRAEVRCASCGIFGHSAEDCKGCYHCGEKGHFGRYCKNAHKNIRQDEHRSPSRSPGPNQSRRGRSFSRSRTPPKRYPRRERSSSSPSRGHGRTRRYSRSRTPIRDLRRKSDQPVPRNKNSQVWQYPCSGRCFSCGAYGHRARNCKEKECFICREKGHIQKDCPKLFTSIRPERRSPSPSRGHRHDRQRQGYSRSRTPPKRDQA